MEKQLSVRKMITADHLDTMTKWMAIMGLFDILANCLSLTMPYSLWAGLSEDLDKSCLTTHAWKEIEKRL